MGWEVEPGVIETPATALKHVTSFSFNDAKFSTSNFAAKLVDCTAHFFPSQTHAVSCADMPAWDNCSLACVVHHMLSRLVSSKSDDEQQKAQFTNVRKIQAKKNFMSIDVAFR